MFFSPELKFEVSKYSDQVYWLHLTHWLLPVRFPDACTALEYGACSGVHTN
jgi:hypothetical protein